jgi:hypothetical protein
MGYVQVSNAQINKYSGTSQHHTTVAKQQVSALCCGLFPPSPALQTCVTDAQSIFLTNTNDSRQTGGSQGWAAQHSS